MADALHASPHYASACVRVDDYDITYLTAGDGPEAVLLLHGFGAWSEIVWSETIPALAQHYRVIAPDLLGFGHSSKPPHVLFAQQDPLEPGARFLGQFMDKLGIERAHFVGSSFGGAQALRFATLAPERVERLVLVGSMGLGRSIHYAYKALASPFVGPRLAVPDVNRIRRMWHTVVHDAGLITDDIVERNHEFLSEPGAEEVFKALRFGINVAGQKVVFYEDLPHLTQPTLLVWGKQDRIFPVRHAHRAASLIPDAEVVVFDDCGHLPPFEHPDAFNSAIARFLATPRPARPDTVRDILPFADDAAGAPV